MPSPPCCNPRCLCNVFPLVGGMLTGPECRHQPGQGSKGDAPPLGHPLTLLPHPLQERTTQLFSATMTSKVQKLQRACLTDPVKVEVAAKYSTVDTLRQQYLFVPAKYKVGHGPRTLSPACATGMPSHQPLLCPARSCTCLAYSWQLCSAAGRVNAVPARNPGWALLQLLARPLPCIGIFRCLHLGRDGCRRASHGLSRPVLTWPGLQECYLAFFLTEVAGATLMLFTRTCDATRRLALMLRNLGFDAIPIHGQMAQAKRIGALNKFKAGERSILVATGGQRCVLASASLLMHGPQRGRALASPSACCTPCLLHRVRMCSKAGPVICLPCLSAVRDVREFRTQLGDAKALNAHG